MRSYHLFILIFLIYGIFTIPADQRAYTLQHAGIEAIVERQTFTLGGSQIEAFNRVGDSFEYKGRRYAAKQPGQFVFGSAVYTPLKLLGFTYETNYILVSVLVSWLTTGLLVALSAVFLFSYLSKTKEALLVSLTYAFGTSIFPYSGLPHHDVQATALLLIAFCILRRNLLISAVLISLVSFFSMLASIASLVLAVYGFRKRREYFVGLILGALPLLLFNYLHFDNPLMQANVVGGYSDTFFSFSLERCLKNFNTYFLLGDLSVLFYMPVLIFSVPALCFLFKTERKLAILIISICFFHLFYILNIETIGHCQYGPRYLLPILPFLVLPLKEIYKEPDSKLKVCLHYLIFPVLVLSILIQGIGALGGTMHCQLDRFAPIAHIVSFKKQGIEVSFLFLPLIVFALGLFLFCRSSVGAALEPPGICEGSSDKRAGINPAPTNITLSVVLGLIYFLSFPRFYSSHDYTFRIAESLLSGSLGLTETPPSWLNEFVPHNGKFYSVFPLGAVLSMLPFVMLKKLGLLAGMPSAFIAAILVGFSSFFAFSIADRYKISRAKKLALVLAIFLGSFLLANTLQGGAWQLALLFSFFAQFGSFYFIFVNFNPFFAGLFFAIAFGNRTELILLAPVFLYLLFFQRKWHLAQILKFCLFPFILGSFTLLYNYLRFQSAFDFGYARIPGVLDEPWYRDGIFAISAIPRNFKQMFLSGFRINETFPYIVPSGFGGSVFLFSPFLLLLFKFKVSNPRILATSWLSIILILAVVFCHGNPGGWQFSYRYAIELLPWVFLIILETSQGKLKTITFGLIAISIVINLYGAWLFNWTDYVRP